MFELAKFYRRYYLPQISYMATQRLAFDLLVPMGMPIEQHTTDREYKNYPSGDSEETTSIIEPYSNHDLGQHTRRGADHKWGERLISWR